MIGLITFAYGAPSSLDDLATYYTHINNGRVQDPKRIEYMKDQYRHIAIGETLGSITKRQVKALEHSLQPYFDEKVKSYAAFKHTEPFVEDIVKQMVRDGITRIVTFPIKPLYSKSGFVFYQILVRNALKKLNVEIPIVDIERWHLHPKLIQVLSNRVETAFNLMPETIKNKTKVIFTSHSMPGNSITHQAFEKQFSELAESIANKLLLPQWRIAYRSAGSQKDVWLGPDILDVIREEEEQGCRGIVVCDLLSVTSNIEVLYDIGFDVQDLCKELGIEFFRTTLLDDSYDFIMALTDIIRENTLLQ